MHILCCLSKNLALAKLVQEIKKTSSNWVKSKGEALGQFQWQLGYGAFSISPSHIKDLSSYIQHQMAHHKKESFQDEFRRFLRTYDLAWDERYVWD